MELMNAPHVLNEIRHSLEVLRDRGEPRTINLFNFPLTDDDARYLDETLGRGALTVSFGGLEHSYWQESKVSGVWWGEYRNANRKVVMRTIEIAEFPVLARAQREDIEDGIEQLGEMFAAASSRKRRGLPVLAAAAE